MVWTAIAHGKRFPLVRLSGTGMERVNAERYTNVILKGPLRDFVLPEEWEKLDISKINKYIDDMPNSVKIVRKRNRKFSE
ncbi:hypothetical protein OC842_006755 [Tilletia horrida]|uniref:Uncharacterized protein n=1 Tax=Tilletia horrida TaxID=155126 RepID=A0AAN6G5E8_9BASI|nr:hypothetical protein OC842_006755 [Tilletia horrida]KAK0547882.1 hypothetical protein OC844_007096 [Tilletia horrida]